MDSILSNNTWTLVDLPPSSNTIGCKWVFRKKYRTDGSIQIFKVRLMAKGFRQREGIDYFDTYAPVAKITSIHVLIALASIYKLVVHQMDVKIAFLNVNSDEEVYMDQPEGFVLPRNERKVCKLVKSLYGLKQAPKHGMKSLIPLFWLMVSNTMELTNVSTLSSPLSMESLCACMWTICLSLEQIC
jgi:hypothetical protein